MQRKDEGIIEYLLMLGVVVAVGYIGYTMYQNGQLGQITQEQTENIQLTGTPQQTPRSVDSEEEERKTNHPELEVGCNTDYDCKTYISHNNCELYCANTDDVNNDTISKLPITCDSTTWDPPLEIDCGCIENTCQLYE